MTSPRIPVLAIGVLCYGQPLHRLLAGTIFAGSTRAEGLCVTSSEDGVGCPCSGEVSYIELYYADPPVLNTLETALKRHGARPRTISIIHGGLKLEAEAYLAPAGNCTPWAPAEERTLVVLPPLRPPPTQPLAAYTVSVRGVKPCSDGQAFCPSRVEAQAKAAVVDIITAPRLLEEWARAAGARITPLTGTLEPLQLPALLYAPVRLTRQKERLGYIHATLL